MTDTITIPLSKLAPWQGNVRKTSATNGIAELAASIAAHGLLQSLVVRKGKRGKYEIVAGQRRYLALCALVKDHTIQADHAVPCILASESSDATELSLAENVIRAPMHPADQFEAFRSLIDDGASGADIAARFGMSELAVIQRLKLGRLSPAILTAYREGEIDLECAQAFTVTDDHEAQERLLKSLTSWNRQPHTIRRALTENEVPTTDKRLRFVGLESYREAGGLIRQDLFSEDDEGYLVDVALLDRLVAEKLKESAAEVSAEGWKWVETVPDLDYQALSRFARRHPEQTELGTADKAELESLSDQYDTLSDSDDDADTDQLSGIEQRMDALIAKGQAWPAATLAIAGAIVTIDQDGDIRIERGLVRKEDLPKAASTPEGSSATTDHRVRDTSGLSERLIEELTAERSAAIGAELMARPDLALAAVVHALTLDALFPGQGAHSCLKMRVTAPGLAFSMAKPDTSKPLAALTAERDRLGDHLPGNPADLWDWCLGASRDELLSLLAYLAGFTVDATRHKNERSDTPRLIHGNQIATSVQLDMKAWYTPTAESYFSRVQRSVILSAIDEAKGDHAPSIEKLKKAELAARAESIVANTGWLPKPLRTEAAEVSSTVEDIRIAAE